MQNKALLSQVGCSCQLGLKLGLAELGNMARDKAEIRPQYG